MTATINRIEYDSDNAMPFNDSCLGRVVDGYLWQMLLVNKKMVVDEPSERLLQEIIQTLLGKLVFSHP